MEAARCYNQYEYFLVLNALRIYDSATGEFVWECDDLDHTSTVMVDTPSVIHSKIPLPIALRNQSGFYLLRVSSVAICYWLYNYRCFCSLFDICLMVFCLFLYIYVTCVYYIYL